MDLPEIEQRLQELIAAIPEPGRAEILRILTIRDDAKRVREIGHPTAAASCPRPRS